MKEETISAVRQRFDKACRQYRRLFNVLDDLNGLEMFTTPGYLNSIRELFNLLNGEMLDIIARYEGKLTKPDGDSR